MTNGRRGQGQRGWWGERGWRQVGAAGHWEREKERRGGRGSGGDEGWRQGKKQRGCRGRKRTRGRGGADPRHEAVREMARDSRMQRERQGETPREGETGSERTEVGGVGGTEMVASGGQGERGGGRVWRAQKDGEARAQIGTGKDH